MRLLLRVSLFAALITLAHAGETRRGTPWPPLDGQLMGELALSSIRGAPSLHWTVRSDPRGERGRRIVLAADGAGAKIRAEIDLDLAGRAGTWKITQADLEAAKWSGILAKWSPQTGPGWAVAGELSVTGSGTFSAGGGLVGELVVKLRNGTLGDASAGWRLEGISLDGRFAIDQTAGSIRSVTPATVNVRVIATKRFGARNLTIDGFLQGLRTFAVHAARVEIAGGTMVSAPCAVELQPVRIVTDVTFNRIGLQDVAALVPGLVASARGRVDGQMHLTWTAVGGFEIGSGTLTMQHDEWAEVRLMPSPGLITGNLPPKVLQFYPGLGDLETGKIPLKPEILEVSFTPQGDAEGRTASIHLAGGPVDPNLRAPVDLVINVRGPLESLIKFGTSSRMHFGGKP